MLGPLPPGSSVGSPTASPGRLASTENRRPTIHHVQSRHHSGARQTGPDSTTQKSGVFHVKHPAFLWNWTVLANARANHPGGLGEDTLPQDLDPHIRQTELLDLLLGRLDLIRCVHSLEESEFAAISNQRSSQRNQGAQCADGASSHDIKAFRRTYILRTRSKNGHVRELQSIDLLVEPGDASLHRFNKSPLHVRAGDREHQARKSGTRADISDGTVEEGSSDHAVEDVTRP